MGEPFFIARRERPAMDVEDLLKAEEDRAEERERSDTFGPAAIRPYTDPGD